MVVYKYKFLIVDDGVIKVNRIALMMSIIYRYYVDIVKTISSQHQANLLSYATKIQRIYFHLDFIVQKIRIDNQFAFLVNNLTGLSILLNVVLAKDRVPGIER